MQRSITLLVPRRTLTIAALLTLCSMPARAQGYPGGGGMGGMGRGGRGGGRGREGGMQGAPGPSSRDVAKQMEELASLKDAINKVPDLDGQQKDSLKAIERHYGEIFKSYGIAASTKLDSARAAGGTPDFSAIRALWQDADSVRSAEFAIARGVLRTDAQRSRFDQNVTDIRAEQAKREEEMRRRRSMGRMGAGGGEPPQ